MRSLSLILMALLFAAATASAKGSDTIMTKSGLKYIITAKGKGKKPKAGNLVIAHYTGTFLDGKVFDSSRERGEPFAFRLGKAQVIKGWDEAIALLRVGDRATLIIPPQLAYGDRDRGTIPPNSTLVFDIELLDVQEKTVGDVITRAMEKGGADAAVAAYEELKKKKFAGYYLSEAEINGLGYTLLQEKRVEDAIAIFKINVDAFPESGNVYDSLGEGYMTLGEKDLAIANYERSLKLSPENTNAVDMLRVLRGEMMPEEK